MEVATPFEDPCRVPHRANKPNDAVVHSTPRQPRLRSVDARARRDLPGKPGLVSGPRSMCLVTAPFASDAERCIPGVDSIPVRGKDLSGYRCGYRDIPAFVSERVARGWRACSIPPLRIASHGASRWHAVSRSSQRSVSNRFGAPATRRGKYAPLFRETEPSCKSH